MAQKNSLKSKRREMLMQWILHISFPMGLCICDDEICDDQWWSFLWDFPGFYVFILFLHLHHESAILVERKLLSLNLSPIETIISFGMIYLSINMLGGIAKIIILKSIITSSSFEFLSITYLDSFCREIYRSLDILYFYNTQSFDSKIFYGFDICFKRVLR